MYRLIIARLSQQKKELEKQAAIQQASRFHQQIAEPVAEAGLLSRPH